MRCIRSGAILALVLTLSLSLPIAAAPSDRDDSASWWNDLEDLISSWLEALQQPAPEGGDQLGETGSDPGGGGDDGDDGPGLDPNGPPTGP
ncbi:MAG: hypothetical protein AAF604_08990 [Acidobacteriota bacterium]